MMTFLPKNVLKNEQNLQSKWSIFGTNLQKKKIFNVEEILQDFAEILQDFAEILQDFAKFLQDFPIFFRKKFFKNPDE